jgi:hypothetical protein
MGDPSTSVVLVAELVHGHYPLLLANLLLVVESVLTGFVCHWIVLFIIDLLIILIMTILISLLL